MSNDDWITDRLPTKVDVSIYGWVWIADRCFVGLSNYQSVREGTPWKPLQFPQPYVKPKRYTVDLGFNGWYVCDEIGKQCVATHLRTHEAAERIAAIFEEVSP